MIAGVAEAQGRMWSARAEDWTEVEEGDTRRFEQVIERVGIGPGDSVLEVGCGSGVFMREVADRGARASGLDASEALVAIAHRRVPEADLRVGDLQSLPYGHDSFDLVAGFNSFFFAADMVEALREARRVTKPGGAVAVQVWGHPDRCDLTPVLRAIASLRSDRPAPGGPALHEAGVLEGIAASAGLSPEAAWDSRLAMEMPGEDALVRRLLSPGPVGEAIAAAGEAAVADAILEAAKPYRTPEGGYRLLNEWHYLVARA